MEDQGYFALLLHAHLPFVRHPEHDEFLEEDWLYEAITETYLPLIQKMEALLKEGVDFRFTLSLTPPLCAMLLDPLLQDRYVRHLDKLLELCIKEIDRNRYDPARHELAWFYHHRFLQCRELFCEKYKKNVVRAFRFFQEAGKIEIITCAATHGYLPLMTDYPEAIRAQILIARDHYQECFGCNPRGIWLPECAYTPGIDRFLQEAEIRWFAVDSHGILFAEPQPRFGIYAPLFTPSGPAAFGRDIESSKQVWSAQEGYPGDPVYRDFYRDLGFDAEYNYIRPYSEPNGKRKFTGLKYHAITGKTPYKKWYCPQQAQARAAEHAENFLMNRYRHVHDLSQNLEVPPLLFSPYDAELFGHWWFEGPEFLHFLFQKIQAKPPILIPITPSEYLEKFPTHQLGTPSASSWGNQGYGEVWLEGSNAWIYPHLHEAARRMTELARKHSNPSRLIDRALKQAARELLLAQSSDWAFIMKTGTMVEYAVKRTKEHLLRFMRLYEQIQAGSIDQAFLDNCEWRNPLFKNLNWRYYA